MVTLVLAESTTLIIFGSSNGVWRPTSVRSLLVLDKLALPGFASFVDREDCDDKSRDRVDP